MQQPTDSRSFYAPLIIKTGSPSQNLCHKVKTQTSSVHHTRLQKQSVKFPLSPSLSHDGVSDAVRA